VLQTSIQQDLERYWWNPKVEKGLWNWHHDASILEESCSNPTQPKSAPPYWEDGLWVGFHKAMLEVWQSLAHHWYHLLGKRHSALLAVHDSWRIFNEVRLQRSTRCQFHNPLKNPSVAI
jgi:hypothetical protein